MCQHTCLPLTLFWSTRALVRRRISAGSFWCGSSRLAGSSPLRRHLAHAAGSVALDVAPAGHPSLALYVEEVRQLLATGTVEVFRPLRPSRPLCPACVRAGLPHHGAEAVFGGGPYLRVAYCDHHEVVGERIRCPYGSVGETRSLKEGWAAQGDSRVVAYRADGECGAVVNDDQGRRVWIRHGGVVDPSVPTRGEDWRGAALGLPRFGGRWRSARYLPTWAVRHQVVVHDVKILHVSALTASHIAAAGLLAAAELEGSSRTVLKRARRAWRVRHARHDLDQLPWMWCLQVQRGDPPADLLTW